MFAAPVAIAKEVQAHYKVGLIRVLSGSTEGASVGRAEPVKAARSAPGGLGLDGRASANTLEAWVAWT